MLPTAKAGWLADSAAATLRWPRPWCRWAHCPGKARFVTGSW